MEVVILLFLLAGASHGMETVCDAKESGAQCYGALNGTVRIQLTDKLSGYEYELDGDTRKRVFKMKNNVVVYYQVMTYGQVKFCYTSGTLVINKIGKEYSDKYIMKITKRSSGATSNHTFQLSVEAPVSFPRLVISECLPQGRMNMSCSCEGDSPLYSWTLDGQALNDSRVSYDKRRSSVTLERGIFGKLNCTIKNHISQDTVAQDVSTCNGTIYVNCTSSNGTEVSGWVNPNGPHLCTGSTTSKPITQTESTMPTTSDMIVIVAGTLAGVLLIAVLLGIYFVLHKKKAAAAAIAEDEDKITYTQVQFAKNNQEKPMKRRQAPVEVEYGEVKVSAADGNQERRSSREVEYGEVMIMSNHRRKVDKPHQEECVYSSVR